jgi:hypothetical protein
MNPLQPCDHSSDTRFDAATRRLSADLCGVARYVAEVVRIAALAAGIIGGGMIAGCTIPSDCGDLDYPTYGGAWQRTRRDSGRVGSVFDPAGARAATLSPRELPETDGETRSARDSILSSPPDALRSPDGTPRADDDPLRQPSPSDRMNPDRLRGLQLEDINIQRGSPSPPDLN